MPRLQDLFEVCTSAPRFLPASSSSILPSQERLLRCLLRAEKLSGRTASRFPAQRCGTALSRCPVLRRRLSARAGGAILAHSIRSVARWAFRPRPLSSASPFQQHSSRQYLTTISFFPSYQDLLAFTVAPETNTLFPLNIFIS